MHTVFALLCFVVVILWLIFPYPSGLLHWYCGNLTIAPVPAKQPWWIWINISCEFIMNDCITTTKQSTTKPCAYFLGYTVCVTIGHVVFIHHVITSVWFYIMCAFTEVKFHLPNRLLVHIILKSRSSDWHNMTVVEACGLFWKPKLKYLIFYKIIEAFTF